MRTFEVVLNLKDYTFEGAFDQWMIQEASWATQNLWAPDVRIANPPPALLAKYTEKEKDFQFDYASFVVNVIRDASVSEGVRRIMESESLHFEKPVDIRVMVFPARPLQGRTSRVLHGSYSHSASQISLYPLRLPRTWIRQDGLNLFRTPFEILSDRKKRLLHEMSETAIATLVHEILHVKFEHRGMTRYGEEALVRKLEREYMQGWDATIAIAVKRALG